MPRCDTDARIRIAIRVFSDALTDRFRALWRVLAGEMPAWNKGDLCIRVTEVWIKPPQPLLL